MLLEGRNYDNTSVRIEDRRKTQSENGEAAARPLGPAANRCHSLYRLINAGHTHGRGVLEAIQHLIGSVLKTSVRLMQLAGRLRGELAELVAVVHVSEGSKNQV